MSDLQDIADTFEDIACHLGRIADALEARQAPPPVVVKVDGKLIGPEVGKQIEEAMQAYRRLQGKQGTLF